MTGLAAALASLAALLAVPAAPRLAAPRRSGPPDVAAAALRRWRAPLSALAAVAAWALLGGALGVPAGGVVGWVAWRTLSAAESPAQAQRRARAARDLPFAVDLTVACLASGAAPAPALRTVAEALGGPVGRELSSVAVRLDVGADPGRVWADLAQHPQLGPLGRALRRAHESGASVTDAGRRLAEELHAAARADVEVRARTVAVRAAAPLGICFLPAFVVLGIVPLVAGLISTLRLFG